MHFLFYIILSYFTYDPFCFVAALDDDVTSIHIRDQAIHRGQDDSQISAHPWRVSSIVLRTLHGSWYFHSWGPSDQTSIFCFGFPLHLLFATGWYGKVNFPHVWYLPLATFFRGRLKSFLVHQSSYYPIGSGVYCAHFPNRNCHQQIRWSRVLRHTHS